MPHNKLSTLLVISAQRGASLLECLIALLLFSFGVLAIIGLQARSIADIGEGGTRAQAALLAEQIIGQMRVDPQGISAYQLNASAVACSSGNNPSTNTVIADWLAQMASNLDGASSLQQAIAVTSSGVVNVTVCWKSPRQTTPHRFDVKAQVQ